MSSYEKQIKEIRELLGVPDNHELIPHVRSLVTQWRATGEPVSPLNKMVLVPEEIIDRFQELNPSNYNHDDVCAINAWGVELVLAAALASPAVVVDEAMVRDAQLLEYFITSDWTEFHYEYADKVRLVNRSCDPPVYQDGWYKDERDALAAALKGGA